jgi:hypothetical protein
MNLLAWKGVIFCLQNNLRASNKGCKIPINPGLFGPNRNIKRPITFRSNRVKKATDNITRRHCNNQVSNNITRSAKLASIVLKTNILVKLTPLKTRMGRGRKRN